MLALVGELRFTEKDSCDSGVVSPFITTLIVLAPFVGSVDALFDQVVMFHLAAKKMMIAWDLKPLIDYESLGKDAALSIPTPDHYLPLLYILGSGQNGERIRFPVEGVDGGSISMLAVQIG